MSGAAAIQNAQKTQGGFLLKEDIDAIAADPETRLTLLLVRCGGGRFLAPANQLQHFIDIIEQHANMTRIITRDCLDRTTKLPVHERDCDYVRDVSLPVNFKVVGGTL